MIEIGQPIAFVQHPDAPKHLRDKFKFFLWLSRLYGKWIR